MHNDGGLENPMEHLRDETGEKVHQHRSRSSEGSSTNGKGRRNSNGSSTASLNGEASNFNTSGSSTYFAPPSTPSPHYGFRRNTANTMQAGRRVPQRSSSAPSSGLNPNGDRNSSGSPVLPSPHVSGASGRSTTPVAGGVNGGAYVSSDVSSPRSIRKSEVEVGIQSSSFVAQGSSGTAHYTSASTTPNANRKFRRGYVGLSGANDDEGPGDDEDDFFEGDNRTGYRHGVHGRSRSGSAPVLSVAGGPSQLPQRLARRSSPSDIMKPGAPQDSFTREGDVAQGGGRSPNHPLQPMVQTSATASPRGSSLSTLQQYSEYVPFGGFTAAQRQRFEEYQNESSPGHQQSHWKMLELMRYWMTSPGIRGAVDLAIREVFAEAGMTKVKEAWGSETPLAPHIKQEELSVVHPPSIATSAGTLVSPKNKIVAKTSGTGKDGRTPAGALPSLRPAVPLLSDLADNGSRTAKQTSSTTTPLVAVMSPSSATEKSSPLEANATRASQAPYDEGLPSTEKDPITPSSSTSTAQSRVPQVVQDAPNYPAIEGIRNSSHSRRRSTTRTRSLSTSAATIGRGEESGKDESLPSASPSDTSRSQQHLVLPPPSSPSLPSQPLSPSPPPSPVRRPATYEEIPRFYFPLGRPTTRERVISGPISNQHENPHLKVIEGVAISTGMYDGEDGGGAGINASTLNKSGEEVVVNHKTAPMSVLHIVDDRNVMHYIQREFGRLTPLPKQSQRVRLLSGRLRGSHNAHTTPFAKQEVMYKQQFFQCMQRICNLCFGMPRYFAFLVIRLIQMEVGNTAIRPASGTPSGSSTPLSRGSGRLGSSSSLLSQNGLMSPFLITAQHLKDFYEKYLKNKDSVRRSFDVLILSSHLNSSGTANSGGSSSHGVPDVTQLRPYLLPQDFMAYIDILLVYHPGLAFLRQTPDFQAKYLDTVIYRIFYELDRFDRGSIRFSEFAASRLMDAFRQVDATEDINTVLLFFSYEHFYVLYCRFWELDEDRDMMLAPEDLMRYAPEDVMNPLIIKRVFAGVGRRRRCPTPNRISYEDFVWYCLSEEDKSTLQAIRYWFRILDLDEDGVLSVYELRIFYDATRNKIAEYVQEGLVPFEDIMCQVLDMLRCCNSRGLSLADLLRDPEAASVALNMLTNVVKFLQFEQRDPFVAHQERLLGGMEQSPWDRFARMEYDRMALEADEEG